MLHQRDKNSPYLSYWNTDEFPYYVASIQSIENNTDSDSKNANQFPGSDVLHLIISGEADVTYIDYDDDNDCVFHVKKNNILFFPGGTRYIFAEADHIEYITIRFSLYTCSELKVQSKALNLTQFLSEPNELSRAYIALSRITHIDAADHILTLFSNIVKEYEEQLPGYISGIQTALIQIILLLFRKNSENFDSILCNINHIGLSSKYSSNTIMPKGCKLTISNVELLSSDPHIANHKPQTLSIFQSSSAAVLDDYKANISINKVPFNNTENSAVEIYAAEETAYHIWFYDKGLDFTPDLRSYKETGFLRFYAKCNIEMYFGIVLYNHEIHKCINHVFHIEPSDEYTEFCVPFLKGTKEKHLNPYIYEILDFISEHYDQKIRLSTIADKIHISASYLSTLFKDEMGVPITEYILNYRLNIAQQLVISHPEFSINDIAIETGFYDASHFSKAFKACYGITVNDYKNHKQNT